MSRNIHKKRPCCICRKWFLPDVRQRGRQITCGPECRREKRKRDCKKWYRKNKDYSKSNYLDSKNKKSCAPTKDKAKNEHKSITLKSMPKSRLRPIFPRQIVFDHFGSQNLIIIEYLIEQIDQIIKSKTEKIIRSKLRTPPVLGLD